VCESYPSIGEIYPLKHLAAGRGLLLGLVIC